MNYIYKTKGTCSSQIDIDYDPSSHIVNEVKFTRGCPGNTLGVSILVKGKTLEEVISLLKGVKCGYKPTSCPDQLATACEEILNEMR